MYGSRAEDFYGAQDISKMFGNSPTTSVPWESAHHLRDRFDFDSSLVEHAVRNPDQFPVANLDPRTLRANQPGLVRPAVAHYLSDEYRTTGRTFADMHQAGNRVPVVYRRPASEIARDRSPQDIILSGHHRAAASLLRGEQFQARVVEGPWGPLRAG